MKKPAVIWGQILVAALGLSFSNPMGGRGGQTANPGEPFNIHKMAAGFLNDAGRPTIQNFGEIPLSFIPNRGQVDEQALFYAVTSRYTLWMTKEGLVFDAAIRKRSRDGLAKKTAMATGDMELALRAELSEDQPADCRRDVSRLVFPGANENPEIVPLEPIEHRVNYFLGCDSAKWKTDIPTSLAVLYKEIYPGIDLKICDAESQVEYDWIVKPGARVEDIRFEYQDVASTLINSGGDLIVETQFGRMTHHRPLSFQSIGRKKVEVPSEFVRLGENEFGFAIDDYDRDQNLIIDPILVYSTYLGGGGDDFATDIAVDRTGAAYVVGYTSSTNFPLRGSYQSKNRGKSDVFVTKFAPSGKALVYSTFLGGSDIDEAYGIAIDTTGAAYVTGETWSSDFPLQNPYLSEFLGGCTDVFVIKINPMGSALAYSTYLNAPPGEGTNNLWDRGRAIAVDSSGAAYVTGWTNSTNFPLLNPFQSTASRYKWNGFVTKFTPAGNALVFSTYLGGSLQDGCWGIAVDNAGSVYVTGWTNSSDFPLQNPYQAKMGGEVDAFVAKFSPAGNALVYSTYLGGKWMEWPYNIAVDDFGAAYVIGETYSGDFPVKNAFQKAPGGILDLFITKLMPSGMALAFSTYLGGSYWEQAGDIVVDKSGAVYVTGETGSPDFPFQNPFQKTLVNGDVFVTKFAASGKALAYSTCLSGNEREKGLGIALDSKGAGYVAGWTYSSNFPLQNPYQKTNRGSWDSFVAKLNFSLAAITMTTPDGGETWKAGSTNTVRWDFTGKTGAWVKIELLKGTKISALIAAAAAIGKNGKGSVKWKVPSGQAAGSDYRIRITSKQYKSLTDTSNAAFTISN